VFFVSQTQEPYLPIKFRTVGILLLLSTLPLFVLLVDGYYQKQLKKSVLLILLFCAMILVTKILLGAFGMGFALAMPVILFVVLALSISSKRATRGRH